MDWWAEIYLFEVVFVSGQRVSQADEDPGMEQLIRKYGPVESLILRPQTPGFKTITIPIPGGAFPVYFRRVHVCRGQQEGAEFHVGWSLRGTRVMIAVDSETGNAELLVE